MTHSEFHYFHKAVIEANKDSDIWYCGALWLDLTDRQSRIISSTLEKKKSCVVYDGEWFEFPNGLRFKPAK